MALPAAGQDSKVKVQIEGVNGDVARNVRAMMALARAADNGPLSRFEIGRLHSRADEDITTALEPFGYYQPRIEKYLERNGEEWIARYIIEPGPEVRVRTVDIDLTGPGAEDPAFRDAVAAFPLSVGDPLRHTLYENGKLNLLVVASDSGYLDADFDTSAVIVDDNRGTADIRIDFRTGQRFHFGPVWFDQDILDDEFLATRVPFKQGDPWRQDRVLLMQTLLAEDPYFSRVEILPRRDSAQGLDVPIRVSLAPRNRIDYEIGAGYGTDTGPRGRAAGLWRWVTRSGHHARADITLSAIQQDASAQYTKPVFLGKHDALTLIGGYARRVLETSTSNIVSVGSRVNRRRLGFRETLSLGWQRESFTVGPDTGVSSLMIVGGSWERTRADDRTFIRRGIRTRLKAQAGTSFTQLEGNAKVVFAVTSNMRLLSRLEVGRVFTGEFRDLPPSLRYFAGGDQSVRGFGYQHLAPEDSLGRGRIGGRSLVTGSLEADFWPVPRWGFAVFTDAGNAMDRFSFSELERSVGVGIRFFPPIGIIRLDAAFPLSSDKKFRLHVSVGPDL